MWYEKLATIAIWAYVVWMIPSGRTVWYGRRDHPNHFGPSYTPWILVYRDEEPGIYWGVVAFHVAIASSLTYVAFFK